MTHKNVRICNCGDCDAAIDRAVALIQKMMIDNECPVFQVAVAAAMGPAVIETYRMVNIDMFRCQGLSIKVAVELADANLESGLDGIEDKIIPRAQERRDEMVGVLLEGYMAQRKRASDDIKAQREDAPNIGKPKE